MKLFWIKVWKIVKKYWQIFLGLFIGLGAALKFWWQLRAQKKVLKNEIETGKKIRSVEKEFVEKVSTSTDAAVKNHDERVATASENHNKSTAELKEEFNKYIYFKTEI